MSVCVPVEIGGIVSTLEKCPFDKCGHSEAEECKNYFNTSNVVLKIGSKKDNEPTAEKKDSVTLKKDTKTD